MTQEYKFSQAQPIANTLPFKKVLVADDNYASRIIIKTLLERESCDVSLAHNGRVAVQLSELGAFDLILMDLQMPILDGLEASRRIRQNCINNQETPIFAITAYSDPEIMNAVKDSGLDDLLLKPFRIENIISAWQKIYQPSIGPHIIEKITPDLMTQVLNTALLDPTILKPLCTAAPAVVLTRLVGRFWVSADQFIATMKETLNAAAAGNAESQETFRKAAHGLKGAAANIGILKGSKLAAQLQNIKPTLMENTLTELEHCLSITRPEIDSFISTHAKSMTTSFNHHPEEAQIDGTNAQRE